MKNKIIHIPIKAVITAMLLLSLIVPVINSVIIEPGYEYNIGNETYRVEQAMDFDRVVYSDTFIIFNNTGWNITSPSNILITLRHINESTTVASENDELLEFEVYLVSGTTTISISGFGGNTLYNIYKDSVVDTSFNSNSEGCIEITIGSGVSYIYTVYRGGNTAPVISGEFPHDGATGVSVSGSPVNIYASDAEGNNMTTDIWSDMTGEWIQLAGYDVYALDTDNKSRMFLTDHNGDGDWNFQDAGLWWVNQGWQMNGTRLFLSSGFDYNDSVTDDWAMTNYSQIYHWSVNCTDGTSWTNQTFSFTTEGNTAPTISSPSPSNGETGVNVGLSSLSVTIADAEDTFDWTITTSPDIGSSGANGASDGTKTCSISGLSYDGYYTWTVSVTDSVTWTNTTYGFTVKSDEAGPPPNSAPTVSNPYPADESMIVSPSPTCHVLVKDANLNTIDVNFYWYNETSHWVLMQTNSTVASGNIVYWNYTNASEYDTTYDWKVTVYDGEDNISYTFNFTIYQDNPVVSTYSPINNSANNARNTTVSITVFDYQGDSMNVTWRSNTSGDWVNFGYNGSVYNGTYTQRFINSTEYDTKYWWSINISGSWTNETYTFTTIVTTAPLIWDPIPRNGKLRISIYITNLSVEIADPDSLFNYTIETNPDIGDSSDNNTDNGVKGCTVSGLNYSITYIWYVNATDGESWTNETYTFTTKGETDFDLPDFMDNLPEFAMGPFKVYVNDFVWVFIFIGMIGLVWGATKNVGSTLIAILLTFAAYGGKRAFVDGMGQQVSLMFSVIAALCLAVLILGLFLTKRRG